jgi:hypothetical protein
VIVARDLLNTLRRQELTEAASMLTAETGLVYQPATDGGHVAGIYRERVTLSSKRFAMIDDGLGFQLVPWRPGLERHLGSQVVGAISPGGTVDWRFGPKRSLSM